VERGDGTEISSRFYCGREEGVVGSRDRWFTIRFRGVMNAWDSDPLQKPIEGNPILPWKNWDSSWRNKLKTEVLQVSPARALVVVTFATDENGRPIARLVHLEKVGDAWRVNDVTDPPQKDR
jgi:hypothetical protein